MAYQNVKLWKYVVKKSFILGNQSKYNQLFFSIDESAKEVTCSSSTKAKDITERFAFEDINQVFDSAIPEDGCNAPTPFGFSISSGGEKVWNIFCDKERDKDDWCAKLNNIASKMQKIRQLSRGSSNPSLMANLKGLAASSPPRGSFWEPAESESRASSQDNRPTDISAAPDAAVEPPPRSRRKSSITFNFDEIDGKKKATEVEIAGANPMKEGGVKTRKSATESASSRPELVKRMTMLNNASNAQISTTGSSRVRKGGGLKRGSEPAGTARAAGDSAAAMAAAAAVDEVPKPSAAVTPEPARPPPALKGGPPPGPPPAGAKGGPPSGPPPATAKKGGPPAGPPPAAAAKGGPPAGPPPAKKGGPPTGPPPAGKGGPPPGPPPVAALAGLPPPKSVAVPSPVSGGPLPPPPKTAAPHSAAVTAPVEAAPTQQENTGVSSSNSSPVPSVPSAGTALPPPPPMKKPVALPPPPQLKAAAPAAVGVPKPLPPPPVSIRPVLSAPHRPGVASAKTATKAPPPPPPPLDD